MRMQLPLDDCMECTPRKGSPTMTGSMARRDFLKAAGAGLGAATLSPALAWAEATLAEAAEAITLSMWIWETVPHWKAVVAGSGLTQRFPNVTMQFTALDYNL